VFENRVLRRISGSRRKKQELHKLYPSTNIGTGDETDGVCSTHGREEKYIQSFDRKT
jgi:hypothetical protein